MWHVAHRWSVLWCGLLLALTQTVAVADDVPIIETEDKTPGSLRGWHLYDLDNASAVLGDKLTFVGRYDAKEHSVSLLSPPWITVAFAREKKPGEDRILTWQVFAFQCEDAPAGVEDKGFVKITGQTALHRPELTPQQKYDQQINIFRIQIAEAEAVPCVRAIEQLEKDAVAEVRQAETRLKEICTKQNLTYNFAADSLSWSWYKDRLAFTTTVTTHPRFSFKPVSYATISVLFDPATGKATQLVFQRRVWQDPRD